MTKLLSKLVSIKPLGTKRASQVNCALALRFGRRAKQIQHCGPSYSPDRANRGRIGVGISRTRYKRCEVWRTRESGWNGLSGLVGASHRRKKHSLDRVEGTRRSRGFLDDTRGIRIQ